MKKMDGYDDCIVGKVTRFGQPEIYCYDKDKIIAKHIEGGMTEEEAHEFFDYNQVGSWVGNFTPCFLVKD